VLRDQQTRPQQKTSQMPLLPEAYQERWSG
jgi:hypothetical protein